MQLNVSNNADDTRFGNYLLSTHEAAETNKNIQNVQKIQKYKAVKNYKLKSDSRLFKRRPNMTLETFAAEIPYRLQTAICSS